MQNSFGILSPEKIKKKLQVCKSKMKCAGKRTISFIYIGQKASTMLRE